jgi:hypothetical protein
MRRFVLSVIRNAAFGIWMVAPYLAYSQTSIASSARPLYVNRAYDFSVFVPPGVTYTRTLPPNPDHGLGITLRGQTKLWVDASYTDASSSDEEARKEAEGCRIQERRLETLGGMSAISLGFWCDATAYGGAYEERLVLSVHRGKDRSPICYQVGMRTGARRTTSQENDFFRKLVAGFKFLE